jgi:hypothetical protein
MEKIYHGLHQMEYDVGNFCRKCSEHRSIYEWCYIKHLLGCRKLVDAFSDRLHLLEHVKSDFE